MYLNSLLFPAPKSSYTIANLKDELIWIPKYHKQPETYNRYHSVGIHTHNPFQLDTSSMETPRNQVPQLDYKIRTQISPTSSTGGQFNPFSDSKTLPKKSMLNDHCKSYPARTFPKANDLSDGSVQEVSSIYDEKTENNPIDIRESHVKLLIHKNMEKFKDLQASHEVSADDIDSPAYTNGLMTLDKKFILKSSRDSGKISKGNLPTRDSSLFTDLESTPHARPGAPQLTKRLSKKASQTFEGIESWDKDCDYDEMIVSEHSNQDNTVVNSPRTIDKYHSKKFSNPHSLQPKLSSDRKFATDCPDSSPEKLCTKFPPNLDLKNKLGNRMSVAVTRKESVEYHIPCMVLRPRAPSNKIMLCFHGNGEDINLARDLLAHVRDRLNITVIAVEYPGYGLYKGVPSEEQVQIDAEAIFDYLTTKLGVHSRNILVFGRSIGSGPATWLASRKNVGGLILMSAFTSIRAVVQHLAGKWAQYLIKERFNNTEYMSRVTCPTFIVHGLKDRLIPHQHSRELYDKCKGLCELVLPKDMNHIEFDFHDDFTTPLLEFLDRIGFEMRPKRDPKINIPPELFQPPISEVPNRIARHETPRY